MKYYVTNQFDRTFYLYTDVNKALEYFHGTPETLDGAWPYKPFVHYPNILSDKYKKHIKDLKPQKYFDLITARQIKLRFHHALPHIQVKQNG